MATILKKLLFLVVAFCAGTPPVVAFADVASPVPATAESGTSPADDAIEAFVRDMQRKHGFDPAWLHALFVDFVPHPAILKAILPAATPSQRSWVRYRARFLTPRRVAEGVRFWDRHARTLERAAAEFGVPERIIVGIIGVETEYGRNTGGFNVLRALATLAFAYPPRADYFREELEEFLLLVRENRLDPKALQGSYAGAIGIPQFMPGSQRRYAVDFDADGRIDLSDNATDAIGSVGSFLQHHGWIKGSEIATRAHFSAPPPRNWADAGIDPSIPATTARQVDASLAVDDADSELVALIELESPDADPEYWWGRQNFSVITRYNRSRFYAMAVMQLGDAVAKARRTAQSPREPKAGSRGKRPRGG